MSFNDFLVIIDHFPYFKKKRVNIDKMKIYCVLFDTAPLCREIAVFAKKYGFSLLHQIGGCFTTTSLVSMFTGQLCSDLESGGMGYDRHNRYREKHTNTIKWPWENQLITSILEDNNWQIKIYHKEYFTQVISNKPSFITTAKYPIIPEIQKEKNDKNTFYFVHYELFHFGKLDKKRRKFSLKETMKVMKQWDYNEPESLFWFFSDHGRWGDLVDHPIPKHFLSWALVKDNITKNQLKINSTFISIEDFFPTMIYKFINNNFVPIDNVILQQKQDQNRLYFNEDGRMIININDSTSAYACKFISWQKDAPTKLIQVSYFKPKDEYRSYITNFDKNYLKGKNIRKLHDEDSFIIKAIFFIRFLILEIRKIFNQIPSISRILRIILKKYDRVSNAIKIILNKKDFIGKTTRLNIIDKNLKFGLINRFDWITD